ncbi:MAG: hypothetical protein QME51_05905 [Planctomycetota bacterium]|nr:hypothetical protein [Planctomycetota bacterium]MDI6787886.1 hypothetical protein [Planctomycetota bacterium]
MPTPNPDEHRGGGGRRYRFLSRCHAKGRSDAQTVARPSPGSRQRDRGASGGNIGITLTVILEKIIPFCVRNARKIAADYTDYILESLCLSV